MPPLAVAPATEAGEVAVADTVVVVAAIAPGSATEVEGVVAPGTGGETFPTSLPSPLSWLSTSRACNHAKEITLWSAAEIRPRPSCPDILKRRAIKAKKLPVKVVVQSQPSGTPQPKPREAQQEPAALAILLPQAPPLALVWRKEVNTLSTVTPMVLQTATGRAGSKDLCDGGCKHAILWFS